MNELICRRWPCQPKYVIENTDNFSCLGITGTFNGHTAHTALEMLMQAGSLLS
jgi:hypothetical protein